MINYISEQQLSIEKFKTPFQTTLLSDNRWVKLSKIVPWDIFAASYSSLMNSTLGRPGISPRIVLGALIIKHMEKLDDRGVIATIAENPYMQFFIGLKEFTPHPVFDPSLFVEIRKRVGADVFDALNTDLISSFTGNKEKRPVETKNTNKKDKDKDGDDQNPPAPNKGKLQMDATVADQYITYPTDSKILNESRKQCEKMIDKLYAKNNKQGVKPRTYRRKMNTRFLNYSKKKNNTKASHRKMNRQLLESVKRDLKHIHKLLDVLGAGATESPRPSFQLDHREQKMLWVVQTVYGQQKKMYDQRSNSCKDRIVSIYQPYVRPIPRGKAKAKIEFGSKLGVSLDQGLARIDTLSWNAYNESTDLTVQVESYKKLHGYYPELVQVDKLYATRENRKWLKERNIRITAPPLGRKSKELKEESYYKKRKRKKEATQRNQIEGKFGQGKNGYNLNQIRATLQKTSESWIAAIFFVMNLIHYQKNTILQKIYSLITYTRMIIKLITANRVPQKGIRT